MAWVTREGQLHAHIVPAFRPPHFLFPLHIILATERPKDSFLRRRLVNQFTHVESAHAETSTVQPKMDIFFCGPIGSRESA